MAPVIGFSSILLALILAIFQPAFVFFHLKIKNSKALSQKKLLEFVDYITIAIFFLCFSSFLSLVYSYIISDYSVLNVYQNSHHLKPLIYKISGVWGNHEGSMLLLTLILSFYNLAFCSFSNIAIRFRIIILSSQSFIISGFLAFIVFTSNPFIQIFPVPSTGLGLNPLLQDIGLAMHPPMLYTGYIGFSLIFSFAIAALLEEHINKSLIQALKPWLMFCWSFLTLGIGLGSWWAYRELGWGGYWFWDPVENVSLMPWLCATALLHSLIITSKTNNFKLWSCFLSILTFIFCLLGIFLVRSGILTSVHSFANDPARGIFIILFLLLVGFVGFLIFAIKAHKLKANNDFALFSKSGLVLANNLLLCLALFIVALGTLYPLFLEILTDNSISIGAPYYKKLFAPLTVVILSLMIFVPFVNLNNFKGLYKKIFKKIIIVMLLSFLGLSLIYLVDFKVKVIVLMAIFIALAVLFSHLFPFFNKAKVKLSYYPIFLSHSGMAIVIIAIAVSSLLSDYKEANIKIGDSIKIADYDITFQELDHVVGRNYIAREGIFKVSNSGSNYELAAQSRYYPVADKNTTESAIKHNILSDLYLVLGSKDEEDKFAIRVYYKPFISFLWAGCLMIFVGGLLSVFRQIRKNIISF